MTRELSKTEKALRLIAKEGITAKEAAERVGISPAAVSKGRLWPSKAAQNVRKLCEMGLFVKACGIPLIVVKSNFVKPC